MATRLRSLKGRFILSINDVPEVRSTFAGFDFQEPELLYAVGGPQARELIIRR